MKCEITGTPENQIDDPDDELAPDTHEELVCKFLNGERNSGIDLYNYKNKDLAANWIGFNEFYRHYKYDTAISRAENEHEFLTQIKEYLADCLMEYEVYK